MLDGENTEILLSCATRGLYQNLFHCSRKICFVWSQRVSFMGIPWYLSFYPKFSFPLPMTSFKLDIFVFPFPFIDAFMSNLKSGKLILFSLIHLVCHKDGQSKGNHSAFCRLQPESIIRGTYLWLISFCYEQQDGLTLSWLVFAASRSVNTLWGRQWSAIVPRQTETSPWGLICWSVMQYWLLQHEQLVACSCASDGGGSFEVPHQYPISISYHLRFLIRTRALVISCDDKFGSNQYPINYFIWLILTAPFCACNDMQMLFFNIGLFSCQLIPSAFDECRLSWKPPSFGKLI